uniref:Uncharacterized protein n=1 Tax=Arundo donax TaxID=35708 RepID=A0A0A9FED9_ARUDO
MEEAPNGRSQAVRRCPGGV